MTVSLINHTACTASQILLMRRQLLNPNSPVKRLTRCKTNGFSEPFVLADIAQKLLTTTAICVYERKIAV